MDQNNSSSNPSGPKKVGKFTITVDRDLCIGAASCVAVAPKAYALDNEAKAIILDTAEKESGETLMDAARACPTAAIIMKDENGKQVFP